MSLNLLSIKSRHPGYNIGLNNLERIRAFFASHLCATNVECGEALGISVEAVGRHVKKIRAEWSKP